MAIHRPRLIGVTANARQCVVNLKIVARHAFNGETAFEGAPHGAAIEFNSALNRCGRFRNLLHDEAIDAVVDDLGDRPRPESDHRRSACHGFDHDKPERFRPVDGKQKRDGVAEELRLLLLIDFAYVLDIRICLYHRLDDFLPIHFISLIDFRRDLQRQPCLYGDFDRPVRPLLGGDSGLRKQGSRLLAQAKTPATRPAARDKRCRPEFTPGGKGLR